MAKCESVVENEGLCKFRVRIEHGNKKYQEGEAEAICIASPTYDLTFKLLFLANQNDLEKFERPVKFIQPEETRKTLISLLNGLYYPEFLSKEQTPEKNRIIEIEIIDSTLLDARKVNIVCKCTLESPNADNKDVHYALYFDIEMQRRHISGREQEFVEYVNALKIKYGKGVHLLAFLNYETEERKAVRRGTMAFVQEGEDGQLVVPQKGVRRLVYQPMICLPCAVSEILNGQDIEIVEGKPIGPAGKEWLKLLGVEWWGKRSKNRLGRYVVPKDVSTPEVGKALEILSKKVDEAAFQAEVKRIFNVHKDANALREEGEQIGLQKGEQVGQLKSLMQTFIKTERFFDFLIAGMNLRNLTEDFIRQLWDEVSDTNTSEQYEAFLQELRTRKLID
ncbi:MAG: hypothetical protein LBD60_00715 [Puniceicoccales bacterium]|jgi:hypothetical protein|nr:hypothetical protein [Puniceicoccales bacterium]